MLKKVCFPFAFATAVLLFTGCTSVKHIPLSQDTSASLKGSSMAATQYPMPDFSAMTAGKATLGLIGAAAMISAGNEIVRENNIPDPAFGITEGLVERLKASRSIEFVDMPDIVAKKDDIKALIAAYPGVDYLLDVKTFNWMFGYYPTDWTHYRVIYNARMRLIDTKAGKVIAETLCRTTQGDDNNPPTREQLLENNAGLLKSYLTNGANQCVDVLARDVLML